MTKTVAVVITEVDKGVRTYTAFTKDGIPVHTVRVSDCGYGAALAIRAIVRAGFTISTSEWAYELARKHCVNRRRTIMKAVS